MPEQITPLQYCISSSTEQEQPWLSLALLIGLMILLMSFEYTDNYAMSTIAHLTGFPLAGLLLWRVETLPQLDEAAAHEDDILPESHNARKRPDESNFNRVSFFVYLLLDHAAAPL